MAHREVCIIIKVTSNFHKYVKKKITILEKFCTFSYVLKGVSFFGEIGGMIVSNDVSVFMSNFSFST